MPNHPGPGMAWQLRTAWNLCTSSLLPLDLCSYPGLCAHVRVSPCVSVCVGSPWVCMCQCICISQNVSTGMSPQVSTHVPVYPGVRVCGCVTVLVCVCVCTCVACLCVYPGTCVSLGVFQDILVCGCAQMCVPVWICAPACSPESVLRVNVCEYWCVFSL